MDSGQSWNASQKEIMWEEIRIIEKNHGDHLTQKSKGLLGKKIKRQVKFNDMGVGSSRYKVPQKP